MDTEKDYEVEEILEARCCPEYRFYFVKWKGYSTKENSWIPALWAEGCAERVDNLWKKCGMCADTAVIPESPWTDAKGKVKTARCRWCCRFFAREQDRKGHVTRGCKCKPGSRTGTATEKAMIKQKKNLYRSNNFKCTVKTIYWRTSSTSTTWVPTFKPTETTSTQQ